MKKDQKQLEKYWDKVSDNTLEIDEYGYSAICYAGMPFWFNKFFDVFQKRSFRRLIEGISLNDLHVLDIGCGVGRWMSEFGKHTKNVSGIDIDAKRLEKAKENLDGFGEVHEMAANELKFDDGSFDFINSITVLQHIPYKEKSESISEMCRVCKSGGYISIIELQDVNDEAGHVFPLSRKQRVEEFSEHGFSLVKEDAYEYIPVLRLLRAIQKKVTGKSTIKKEDGAVQLSTLSYTVLKIVTYISYPIEVICEYVCKKSRARHTSLLFKKS